MNTSSKINLYWRNGNSNDLLFSELNCYDSFHLYTLKNDQEKLGMTVIRKEQYKEISKKYNVKCRNELEHKILDFYGTIPKQNENIFVVRFFDFDHAPVSLIAFGSKSYYNCFLSDLEEAIKQYLNPAKVKHNLSKIEKTIRDLGIECLELFRKIKIENDPFLKSNLQNEFDGKIELKKELDFKFQNLNEENKRQEDKTPKWEVICSHINFNNLINKYMIKNIEDIKLVEVPFECNRNLNVT